MRLPLIALLTLTSAPALADVALEKALEKYFDNDHNGLSAGERARMMKKIDEIQTASVAAEKKVAERKANQSKEELWKTGVLVRDAYQTGAFLDDQYKAGDGGASFIFTNDFYLKKPVFSASGSVMYGAFGEVNRLSDGGAAYVGFLGGIAFDTNWSGATNSGQVSALAGLEVARALGPDGNLHFFKLDAVYTTDLEAKASIAGLEARWMPFSDTLGWGSPRHFGKEGQVVVLFRPALSVDYAHVASTGNFSGLLAGSDYLWGGVKAKLDVFFENEDWDELSFSLKYSYMYDFLRRGRDSIQYIEASANYKLNDNTFIEAVYTYGSQHRSLEWRNDIKVGLTVQLGELERPKSEGE